MYALLLTDIGDRYTFHYANVSIPHIRQGEALVKVSYCGINHLDLLIASGKRHGPEKLPHVLGSEIVGTVHKIENDSKIRIKKGDLVVVYPWTFCGSCNQCLNGNEQMCDAGGTIGRTIWGGYAEYVRVPVTNLVKLPDGIPVHSACAITLAGTTAHHLIRRAGVRKKSTVLVTGATGGVGLLVIQLLKQMHCTIVAVTSSAQKGERLRQIGVDTIINTDKLVEQSTRLFPNGFDHVIDIMGGDIWSESVKVLAKGGSMSFCSTTLDGPGAVHIGNAFAREINIHGSYGGTKKDLHVALELLQQGVLAPVIDSMVSLKNAATALEKLQSKRVFGKVIVKAE